MLVTKEVFLRHPRGRKFSDAVAELGEVFDVWCDFLTYPPRVTRMKDSCDWHDRPALAGVIKEMEANPNFQSVFKKRPLSKTWRYRQLIGTLVRVVMEVEGYVPAKKAGCMKGLSKWFSRAMHYQRGVKNV